MSCILLFLCVVAAGALACIVSEMLPAWVCVVVGVVAFLGTVYVCASAWTVRKKS